MDFALTFPTVDHITDQLNKLGPGSHLYKVDVSRAFRHIKLDPGDYNLLGLTWCQNVYVDTCLPFGSHHRTQIFQHLSDAVCHFMCRDGYVILNYIDDFIGVGVLSVVHVLMITYCIYLTLWAWTSVKKSW